MLKSEMGGKRLLQAFFICATISSIDLYPNNMRTKCPSRMLKPFRGYLPQGNLSAGIYTKVEGAVNLKNCVRRCCDKDDCNVVLVSNDTCYHISCENNVMCLPEKSPNVDPDKHLIMVLVKTVDDKTTWREVIESQPDFAGNGFDFGSLESMRRLYNNDDEMEADETTNYYGERGCSPGVGDFQCPINEECIKNGPKSRAGTCTCRDGFRRNRQRECIPIDMRDAGIHPDTNEMLTERIIDVITNDSAPVTRQKIAVYIENKEVKLPKDEVTLEANVNPDDKNEEEKYQYEWTSLQQPDGSTAVKHQSDGGQLQLTKLVEGLYTFKVSVSNSYAYGESFVNVTVLPPSRINKPPVIVIIPANQTIKQPNMAAVMDASSTTDDDGIISWHWELQQGPLGYQPDLKDSATLQLNDLTKPGNYTFKLTVTDTDKATSSATANVTVLKFTDYPPEANAGEDKIIYLPHNKIVLNGNLSSDDHAITTWEWTKSPDDAQKAVDMQDTRTPYLQLSNLEEGMYTFMLRVTDSANQSSTAQVHVFVKPPTNKPPVAEGGHNITISLPQTWTVLDASNSSDDNKIVTFKWELIEGPSKVTFLNLNSSKTNVTGLTKGVYNFKVSVTDDNNNVASDNVYVTVNQNVNEKPKADAGKDFEIDLPVNAVTLNGSNSKDDWAIVKWKWVRDDRSLAIGKIAEKTDESPILIVTDVVVGTYIFNLTVFDEQGLSDMDSITFTVRNDPKLFYLSEITLDIDANSLTQAQYDTLVGKLALLVSDGSKLKIRDVKPALGNNKAVITFYVQDGDGKPRLANEVVKNLREKLRVDASLLGFSLDKLQTVICQNNCSGHGFCDEKSRKCECEAFWMSDMFKVYLQTDEDSDCSWSVLYVVLGLICGSSILIAAMWGSIYLCYTWCSRRRAISKPTTYKLIEDTDDIPPFSSRKSNLSDSDTDSDVVFESRTKSRFGESRNGHKPTRNGFGKTGRRIKT